MKFRAQEVPKDSITDAWEDAYIRFEALNVC
jgi:hypothetical protein